MNQLSSERVVLEGKAGSMRGCQISLNSKEDLLAFYIYKVALRFRDTASEEPGTFTKKVREEFSRNAAGFRHDKLSQGRGGGQRRH